MSPARYMDNKVGIVETGIIDQHTHHMLTREEITTKLNQLDALTQSNVTALLTELEKVPDLETLAAQQHAIWSHWMKHFYSVSHIENQTYNTPLTTTFEISFKNFVRWSQQMDLKYEELTEHEKESDRAIVRRFVLGGV